MQADIREDFYYHRIRECGPRYEWFDLATVDALVNLQFTYELVNQSQSRYMADFGLSKSSFNILMVLRHAPPEGMLLHDLGEMLLVSRANITGLMDHLEEKGYVTRVVDATDRRARFARITTKAEAVLDELLPVHFHQAATMTEDLSVEDKQDLARLLRKMRCSVRAHAEQKRYF